MVTCWQLRPHADGRDQSLSAEELDRLVQACTDLRLDCIKLRQLGENSPEPDHGVATKAGQLAGQSIVGIYLMASRGQAGTERLTSARGVRAWSARTR